jgi:hypothetical protein
MIGAKCGCLRNTQFAPQTIMALIIVWTVDSIEQGSTILLIDRIRFASRHVFCAPLWLQGVRMTPSDFFGYQISDNGRLVLPGLTPEETLEYEMLSRHEPEQRDRLSEMRQLELYLKQHKAKTSPILTAKSNLAPPREEIYTPCCLAN